MKYRSILLCLLLLCFTPLACAEDTYEQDDVLSIDYACPDNYLISGVNLDNIEPNFNSTCVLDSFGREYILYINNTKSVGWWTFYVSVQYPNGTIVSADPLDSFQPFATDADIKIQPFYMELDSGLDVDVYVGLMPLSATFSQNSLLDTYTEIGFRDVQASCNNEFDFKADFVDEKEFADIVGDDLGELFEGSIDLMASGAWDRILSVVESIPYIGPYFVSALEISAILIDDMFFYFNLFFIEYLETTIMIVEFFILSGAVIKTRRKSNVFAIIDKIVNSHIKLFEFVFNIISITINIFTRFLSLIVQLIGAIVPF